MTNDWAMIGQMFIIVKYEHLHKIANTSGNNLKYNTMYEYKCVKAELRV